jgi:hypothetical protein
MFQVRDHTLYLESNLKMATRNLNLKRKREEMQEQNPDSMHEISWQGEWLPVELWTRVFYHVFISGPIRTDSMDQFDTIQDHPLIAGIILEFLLFRTGVTHMDLCETPEQAERFWKDIIRYWIPVPDYHPLQDESRIPVPRSASQQSLFKSYETANGIHFKYVHGVVKIRFKPRFISISLGFLITFIPEPNSVSYLGDESQNRIQIANRVLPYGLHFCKEDGFLHIRMPNNPRTANSKYRTIRSFEIQQKSIRRKLCYGYEVQCSISLNELYVPSWRPYSEDGDTGSESQAETGGDAGTESGFHA